MNHPDIRITVDYTTYTDAELQQQAALLYNGGCLPGSISEGIAIEAEIELGRRAKATELDTQETQIVVVTDAD